MSLATSDIVKNNNLGFDKDKSKTKIVVAMSGGVDSSSHNKVAFSESGAASVYKITIQQIALCETGSALNNCLNPAVVYEADSGTIDIASTTAGAAAATLGSATEAVVGTSYTYVQVVMNRLITISGTGISDGSATCGTAGGIAGTISANATGIAGAGAGELVVAAGYAGAAPGTTAFSGYQHDLLY